MLTAPEAPARAAPSVRNVGAGVPFMNDAAISPVERLARLVGEYHPESLSEDLYEGDEDHVSERRLAASPLLLIEVSRSGDAPFFSFHRSAEEASEYYGGQEAPEYWKPELLVDLVTGKRYRPIERISLGFTPIEAPGV